MSEPSDCDRSGRLRPKRLLAAAGLIAILAGLLLWWIAPQIARPSSATPDLSAPVPATQLPQRPTAERTQHTL